MPKLDKLNALVGSYVNLEFPLPSGMKAKFLKDHVKYGNHYLPQLLDKAK